MWSECIPLYNDRPLLLLIKLNIFRIKADELENLKSELMINENHFAEAQAGIHKIEAQVSLFTYLLLLTFLERLFSAVVISKKCFVKKVTEVLKMYFMTVFEC